MFYHLEPPKSGREGPFRLQEEVMGGRVSQEEEGESRATHFGLQVTALHEQTERNMGLLPKCLAFAPKFFGLRLPDLRIAALIRVKPCWLKGNHFLLCSSRETQRQNNAASFSSRDFH